MKKISKWLLPVLLFVFSSICTFQSFGQDKRFSDILTPSEQRWIEQHGAISYVYDPDWAPFEWKSEHDAHTGIIADLISLIGDKTGLSFVAVNTDTWAESVDMVREGKADMFSAITVTEERNKYLNFTSKDIYTYPAVLLAKFDDSQVYLDLNKDARQKTIAIVKDSGLGEYVRKSYPQLTYLEVPSTKAGLEAVIHGEADLFSINSISARFFIEQSYQEDLKIATKLDYIYHLKIAVRNNEPAEFISVLNKALKTVSDSEQREIFKKWTTVAKTKQVDWELVIELSLIFLAILAFIGWHYLKLKKVVHQKTIALRNLANSDPLTGVSNRRKLDDDFKHGARRADRHNHKMALLYIDLNNFKLVNDNHGHKQGDYLLKEVAGKISRTLRDNEMLYRVGGDEFCILLPEVSDKDDAGILITRINEQIAHINQNQNLNVDIGCSIGISLYPEDGQVLDALMAVADKDMYVNKAH